MRNRREQRREERQERRGGPSGGGEEKARYQMPGCMKRRVTAFVTHV